MDLCARAQIGCVWAAEGCCLECEGFATGLAARARCPRASPFSYGLKKQFFEGMIFLIFSWYVFWGFFRR